MAPQRVVPLLSDTYLAVVENSVGSRLFRTFYAKVDGRRRDIMRGGELSCAFYLSSVLTMLGLLRRVHGTVDGALRDLAESGWRRISRPRAGSVLLWEAVRFPDGELHRHLGFSLGGRRAVSNNSRRGVPVLHHWTFGRRGGRPVRRVEAILWHKKLGRRT